MFVAPDLLRRVNFTLRIGSPSDTVSAMAMAPSERTRQSPKLITWTLRKCFRACEVTHCNICIYLVVSKSNDLDISVVHADTNSNNHINYISPYT